MKLFDDSEFMNWKKDWEGMPEYTSENKKPTQQIIVSFSNFEDVKKFSELIGQKLTPNTKSVWFPKRDRKQLKNLLYKRI